MGRFLPRRFFVALGAFVGRVCFDVFRIRRQVTLGNLRRVFGQRYDEAELTRLARRSYAALGSALLEFCSLWSMSREELVGCVRMENLDVLEDVLAQGKGCIFVTGHYGSWELYGASFAARGYKTTFLVKDMKNPLVARMQDELRVKGSIDIVKDGPLVARGVLRALQKNHLVGVLPDQDARRHGVFVDFLGTPASTYKGAAFFAYRANVPIITAYVRRLPDGSHLGRMYPAIYPDRARGEEEEIARLTQAYTDYMNDWIRRYPEEYFWVHRRWKTAPPPGWQRLPPIEIPS
jgi:KDO2-lipid IV(A) lauroyltransferase